MPGVSNHLLHLKIFLIYFFLVYVYVCFACMNVSAPHRAPQKGLRSPGMRIAD